MKVTINTTGPQSREIDWSKKMAVSNGDYIVLTTGEHDGMFFSGMQVGKNIYSTMWNKNAFTPCTTPITVTFENEL